jgi:glycerophosphoryl diester phosphodiesterase
MLLLAHRGANRLAPENTVPAMRRAIELGADGVELDVHRSADGVLVVRHDAETAIGRVGELTLRELQITLGEIPTLAEILDVCRGRLVNVEIKDLAAGTPEAVVALLAERAAEARDDVLVSSFDLATVDRVRALDAALPTGYLSFGLDPLVALAAASDHGHAAVHPDVGTLATVDVDELVAHAHDLGVQVNVWTVNDETQMQALRDAGVDAVITDDSELYGYGVTGRSA